MQIWLSPKWEKNMKNKGVKVPIHSSILPSWLLFSVTAHIWYIGIILETAIDLNNGSDWSQYLNLFYCIY